MALPENFSPQDHLQDQVRRIWNKEIKDWFADLNPDTLDPDITVPRQSIYVACRHQDNDSAIETLMRMQLFDLIRGKAIAPIAGVPLGTVHETRKFKPQIFFYFQEDEDDIETGYGAVTGEVSIRLTSQDDISPTEALTYANRIKSEFGSAGGYIWKKGKATATYKDPSSGLDSWFLVRNKQEGNDLVSKLLDVDNKTPNWEKFFYNENEAPTTAYPTIPPTQTIYGKARRLPRRRPIADVRFQYAVLHLWGIPNPICLYDRSGVWSDPLVS
jgi:hypothetical protein